jgi:hypothetical protein
MLGESRMGKDLEGNSHGLINTIARIFPVGTEQYLEILKIGSAAA